MRDFRKRLTAAGLIATHQRLALAQLLYGRGHRHVTADELYAEAKTAGLRISRATVYNTLHAFVAHGLLREIPIEPDKAYFDTNVGHVCHLFVAETGELHDLHPGRAALERLSARLGGVDLGRISVVIYVDGKARALRRSHRGGAPARGA